MSKLYARYASMNAGKSLHLLAALHNYKERGLPVSVFTAAIDTRHGVGKVTSRVGLSCDARLFDESTVFDKVLVGDVSCVLLDEAQFLQPVQVHQLHRLAHSEGGPPIICYGIRTDFLGRPFAGAATLLCLADDLEELKVVCGCEKKASMQVRIDASGNRIYQGDQVLIGGNSRYVAVCADCFYREGLVGQMPSSTHLASGSLAGAVK